MTNNTTKDDAIDVCIKNLNKDDLGLIELKDYFSYVAVKKAQVVALLKNIENEKIKGKKYKIGVAM